MEAKRVGATCAAVVPAAGRGERVGSPCNKLLLPLAGKPVLARTLAALDACPEIAAIILAVREQEREAICALVRAHGIRKVREVVAGGASRQESVYHGVQAVPDEIPLVAVHDGARPLILPSQITACIEEAARVGAALLALPVTDTLKEVDPEGQVRRTLDRSCVWRAQTPQVFRRDWLLDAHRRAAAEGYQATDCCDLLERLGYPVKVVPGSPENIKITSPQDFAIAEGILRERSGQKPGMAGVRVGFGYDAHRLAPGRALVLGGVRIPYERGLEGHSDADVLLHAVTDALLGAIAAGDIGRLFPPTDPAYKDADSRLFLRRAGECVRERGMRILCVDATLMAEAPKIAPYVPQMRAAIAETLQIELDRVSVKATTTEGMGFTGRGEGMAAQAVATVCESEAGG